MKLHVEYYLPVILFVLTSTQRVSGCADTGNCIECVQSNCSYYQCGNAHVSNCQACVRLARESLATKCVTPNENYNCTEPDNSPIVISELDKCPTTTPVSPLNATTLASTNSAVAVSSPSDIPTPTTTTSAPVDPAATASDVPHSGSANKPPPTINRRFDGPSFIGGIILALGLIAIAYVGLKFYWARTERNYHTL